MPHSNQLSNALCDLKKDFHLKISSAILLLVAAGIVRSKKKALAQLSSQGLSSSRPRERVKRRDPRNEVGFGGGSVIRSVSRNNEQRIPIPDFAVHMLAVRSPKNLNNTSETIGMLAYRKFTKNVSKVV